MITLHSSSLNVKNGLRDKMAADKCQALCLTPCCRSFPPPLARSLQQLLDHDGDDVEEVFCLNFAVSETRLTHQSDPQDSLEGSVGLRSSLGELDFDILFISEIRNSEMWKIEEPSAKIIRNRYHSWLL